jgi:hypothetical protein
MSNAKKYCNGCRVSRSDTRLYRYTDRIQSPLRFCRSCAVTRTNIEPAENLERERAASRKAVQA